MHGSPKLSCSSSTALVVPLVRLYTFIYQVFRFEDYYVWKSVGYLFILFLVHINYITLDYH